MVTVQKERETREEIVYMYHSRTYAGNPNDLYSVDELKDFYVYNKTFLNSRLFVHSICTIQSHILKFEPFLTSFDIFHAFNDLFCAK